MLWHVFAQIDSKNAARTCAEVSNNHYTTSFSKKKVLPEKIILLLCAFRNTLSLNQTTKKTEVARFFGVLGLVVFLRLGIGLIFLVVKLSGDRGRRAAC